LTGFARGNEENDDEESLDDVEELEMEASLSKSEENEEFGVANTSVSEAFMLLIEAISKSTLARD
jgi:hypothetical protein